MFCVLLRFFLKLYMQTLTVKQFIITSRIIECKRENKQVYFSILQRIKDKGV